MKELTAAVSVNALSVVVFHLTWIFTCITLAHLSRIFGAARRKKPRYPLFYVASVLAGIAMALELVGSSSPWIMRLALGCDVTAGLLAVAVTWFYWDWLPRELTKG